MTDKLKILAISGSTRKVSSNLHLIHAIANLSADIFQVEIFEGLTGLPHFNPDIEPAPQEVIAFRKLLNEADGVLICTPEYAIGVPGTLKNAIDWTVSDMNFSKKPVALITASLSGAKGHQSLLGTLQIIEARLTDHTQLLISGIKVKVNDQAVITDEVTLQQIQQLITSLAALIKGDLTGLLPAPSLFPA
ncbi:flavoprotein [Chitinophaga sp. SYP-B3965]|uniref:NADPH-dependent FMN reductase n=1 Tax=Chitinophaga sp. SYP-B3965 TaxID=2663120 RepID=UPI0012996879|nr:NADPH-dependent FMN reductase [Chitinophaga sp. SYP-B3965]MRG43819.1 flavoprotein [Chitinophaga sp. SYP-B3965]